MALQDLFIGRGKWIAVGIVAVVIVTLVIALPIALHDRGSKSNSSSPFESSPSSNNSTNSTVLPDASSTSSDVWNITTFSCGRSPLLDMIVFGNTASERAHNFYGPGSYSNYTETLPLKFPQRVTFRQVMPDPDNTQNGQLSGNQSTMLNVTIKVDPTRPTYITLKLYGSDPQQGGIFMFWRPPQQPVNANLYPGMVSIGAGLLQLSSYNIESGQGAGYGGLEITERGPNPYPRHFYYGTMLIPPAVTANRSELNIILGGWSYVYSYTPPRLRPLNTPLKPIYRVYTHLDPFFEPAPSPSNNDEAADVANFEPHTVGPAPRPLMKLWSNKNATVTKEQLQKNLTNVQGDIDRNIRNLLNNQIWGSWDVSMQSKNPSNPYAVPDVLWGAMSMPTSLLSRNLTSSEWLNTAAQNIAPGFVGALGLAYETSWSDYYHNESLVARAVAAIDFLMYAACSNYGWTSSSTWYGAPNRTGPCGSFDGMEPWALSVGIAAFGDAFEKGGHLDQLVDPNLNGIRVSRRTAWWEMMGFYGKTVFERRRGGCPSQDNIQAMAIVGSQLACISIDKARPPPFNETEFAFAVNQTSGFVDRNARTGAWFTDTGMIMECGGVALGGMDGNYGPVGVVSFVWATAALWRIPGSWEKYQHIQERLSNASDHLSMLVYAAHVENRNLSPLGNVVPNNPVNGYGNPIALVTQTTINTRVEHTRDMQLSNMYHVVWYMAAFKNPLALRIQQSLVLYNQWDAMRVSSDGLGISLRLAVWPLYQKVVDEAFDDSSVTNATLITETATLDEEGNQIPLKSSASVEITAGAVIFRYGGERMWINMNYRHSYNTVNNLARILHHGINVSRISTAYFNAYDGYFGLWTLQYGPYFIAINRQTNVTYTFDDLRYSTSHNILGEIISGKALNTSDPDTVLPPRSAWVLVSLECEYNN